MQCLIQEVSFESVVVLWFAFLDLMLFLLFFQSFCTPALPIWGPGMPVTNGSYLLQALLTLAIAQYVFMDIHVLFIFMDGHLDGMLDTNHVCE